MQIEILLLFANAFSHKIEEKNNKLIDSHVLVVPGVL